MVLRNRRSQRRFPANRAARKPTTRNWNNECVSDSQLRIAQHADRIATKPSPVASPSVLQPLLSNISPLRRPLAIVFAIFVVALIAGPTSAQQKEESAQLDPLFEEQAKVSVRVKSGRTFVAYLDARTDDKTLWLRFEGDRATLWRPIAWHRVESATLGAKTFTADQLRQAAARLASTESAARQAWPAPQTNNDATEFATREPAPSAPHVSALSLDVRYANWDADHDDDGFIAAVTPLDDSGHAVTATGTLTVELIGMTAPRTIDYAGIPVTHEQERPTLETWTVQLDAADFLDGTAQVRLRFRNGDPAEDPRLQNHGVLHARLAVPGSNVVEAELDPIRLRSTTKVGSGRN